MVSDDSPPPYQLVLRHRRYHHYLSNGMVLNGLTSRVFFCVYLVILHLNILKPTELPNVSLSNPEMEDSLPVSSSTDWSAAFGFRNKDLTPDIDNDDLGLYCCK